jgi:hypothetical protein
MKVRLNTMRRTIALVAVAGAVITPTALAVNTKPVGMSTAEYRALMIRSEAMNQKYGLDRITGPSAPELRALRIRGEAMNQKYGLTQLAPDDRPGIRGADPTGLASGTSTTRAQTSVSQQAAVLAIPPSGFQETITDVSVGVNGVEAVTPDDRAGIRGADPTGLASAGIQTRALTRASVLGSLGPSERRYVEQITSMTPAQLKATFGTGMVGAAPSGSYVNTPDVFERAVNAGPEQYGVGPTVESSSTGFDWSDFGIGAAAAAGVALLLGGLAAVALTARQHRGRLHSA